MNQPLKSDEIYELSLSTRSRMIGIIDILEQMLVNVGCAPDQIVRKSLSGKIRLAVYFVSLDQANLIKEKILFGQPRFVTCRIVLLRPVDWRDKWKVDFKPFTLTSSFDVVPVWYKFQYLHKHRRPIYLDTTSAFGTGLHETTRFMARLIDRCRGRFRNFLDIGTGAGLLSILAYYCGAQSVVGIDIDRESVKSAQKNLAANGMKFTKTYVRDFEHIVLRQQFDFVAANLITYDLIAMRDRIVSRVRKNRYLAVSGISLPYLNELKKAFQTLPLRCLKIQRGKKWAAILYIKKS